MSEPVRRVWSLAMNDYVIINEVDFDPSMHAESQPEVKTAREAPRAKAVSKEDSDA